MPPRTVLILADPQDEHAQYVRGVLAERGHQSEVLDSFDFPGRLRLAFEVGRGGRVVVPGGAKLDWAQVHSIYWRNYNGVAPSALPDAEQAYIAENDSRSLVESTLIRWPCRWVNGWDAYRLHQTKPAQLDIVRSLDLPPTMEIPATLWTNDPQAVRAFADEYPQCIFKPVQGGAHTRHVSAKHLTSRNLANLAHAPVTLQQYVEGTDVRVFLAGRALHACRLETDALDFRDDRNVRIVPADLPPDVADACRRIAAALKLVWTGIDLRLTEDGRYFYFEANPSPMFMGFEQQTHLPLTDALVTLLTD